MDPTQIAAYLDNLAAMSRQRADACIQTAAQYESAAKSERSEAQKHEDEAAEFVRAADAVRKEIGSNSAAVVTKPKKEMPYAL